MAAGELAGIPGDRYLARYQRALGSARPKVWGVHAHTDANQFQPVNVTVARGASVNWVNTGQSPHTVTDDPSKAASPSDSVLPSGAQPWDSGTIGPYLAGCFPVGKVEGHIPGASRLFVAVR